jgi:hypothetical protein
LRYKILETADGGGFSGSTLQLQKQEMIVAVDNWQGRIL